MLSFLAYLWHTGRTHCFTIRVFIFICLLGYKTVLDHASKKKRRKMLERRSTDPNLMAYSKDSCTLPAAKDLYTLPAASCILPVLATDQELIILVQMVYFLLHFNKEIGLCCNPSYMPNSRPANHHQWGSESEM